MPTDRDFDKYCYIIKEWNHDPAKEWWQRTMITVGHSPQRKRLGLVFQQPGSMYPLAYFKTEQRANDFLDIWESGTMPETTTGGESDAA